MGLMPYCSEARQRGFPRDEILWWGVADSNTGLSLNALLSGQGLCCSKTKRSPLGHWWAVLGAGGWRERERESRARKPVFPTQAIPHSQQARLCRRPFETGRGELNSAHFHLAAAAPVLNTGVFGPGGPRHRGPVSAGSRLLPAADSLLAVARSVFHFIHLRLAALLLQLAVRQSRPVSCVPALSASAVAGCRFGSVTAVAVAALPSSSVP